MDNIITVATASIPATLGGFAAAAFWQWYSKKELSDEEIDGLKKAGEELGYVIVSSTYPNEVVKREVYDQLLAPTDVEFIKYRETVHKYCGKFLQLEIGSTVLRKLVLYYPYETSQGTVLSNAAGCIVVDEP